jgi:hypothetical protein
VEVPQKGAQGRAPNGGVLRKGGGGGRTLHWQRLGPFTQLLLGVLCRMVPTHHVAIRHGLVCSRVW